MSSSISSPAAAPALGWWTPETETSSPRDLPEALLHLNETVSVVAGANGPAAGVGGAISNAASAPSTASLPLLATLPPQRLEHLGDPRICALLDIRYPLIGGSMAKGISSEALVEALAQAGMLGFFGAAGLSPQRVEAAIDRLQATLGELPFGCNLIHSPNEPQLEADIVALYLRKGVRLVEASAFLDLTLPIVRYRLAGIHRAADGSIVTPNRVIAKVSREEVASKFLAPPPAKFVSALVESGELSSEQAELASQIPMAIAVTAEADSGGHTDNRPALALLPTICAVRDRLQSEYGYSKMPLVGLGGGIGTPLAAAAAFAMGAAYLVTGTVNQACVESGTSDVVRQMLVETRQADVTMAPAADMFEMGVDVQVLKRGTMFSMRASRLYELYRQYDSIETLPASEREKLEKTLFKAPLETIWSQTRAYFLQRDRSQVERAERDPKHRLALVFRWYLGQSPHWANDGDPARKVDYQIWCGPAMGAFNEWTRGSFLETVEERRVATVSLNLLLGAAYVLRRFQLQARGLDLRQLPLQPAPLGEAWLKELLS